MRTCLGLLAVISAAVVALTTVPGRAFASDASVSVASPASGVVSIQGAATPVAAKLRLLVDGSAVKTCAAAATCTFAWDTTKVADGNHTIAVRALDASNHETALARVVIQVVNAAPAPAPAPAPTPTPTPVPTTGTYRTDSGVYQVPALTRPALGVPMTDPVFGSIVTRVTDPSMGSAEGFRHEYTRLAALSADNTKAVVIQMTGWNYQVLDLATGRLQTIPGIPCGLDPSVTWHRTDPDLLIYFCDNEVRTYRVSTATVTTLAQLTEYTYVWTREEGTVSDDWRYAAVFGRRTTGAMEAAVVDLQTGVVIARNAGIAFGDWIGISPSGQYVVIQHEDATGTRVYDRSLTYLRTLHADATHEDFAVDEDGQDVIVYYAWSNAQTAPFGGRSVVAKARLADGATTELIDTKWQWGGHVSGVGSRGHPGWVLASDYRAPGDPQIAPFQREVFWLKMDGSGQVKRIAHHHSDVAEGGSIGKDYWAEPHPVASWDGSLVLFASTWGDSFTRYDAYTVRIQW
ncbi:MAG TPA: hypothetical protein VGT02_18005 [Methylomirabilota bacterium]|nr:hypothetical protein [Methylomirabilota bacterium]